MHIIETFEPSCRPRHWPSALIRIDTSCAFIAHHATLVLHLDHAGHLPATTALTQHAPKHAHPSQYPTLAPLSSASPWSIQPPSTSLLRCRPHQNVQPHTAKKRQFPIALAERSLPYSRGFLPWRLSDTGLEPGPTVVIGRYPKPFTSRGMVDASSTRQKFLRKQTESLPCRERGKSAMSRREQTQQKSGIEGLRV